MVRAICLGVFTVLIMGCTPESLEGFDPAENNAANNTNNGSNNTNAGTFTPQFVQVTNILATNCTQSFCHGSNAANAFVVPTDQNATPAEMRDALQGKNATSGNPLVAASNPDGSELWIRMTLPTTDAGYMPSTKLVLSQADYDAISGWITAGAVYTQ